MLVMVVFFIAFRWIHLSTPLIRLFLLVLILLLMPTLNFLPVWFALSLLRFRLPSRLPMMFIFFQAEDGIGIDLVTGVQTCALPISPGNPQSLIRWGQNGLSTIGNEGQAVLTPANQLLRIARCTRYRDRADQGLRR